MPISVLTRRIRSVLLLGLMGLSVTACFYQAAPEVDAVDTLILHYEDRAARQAFQTWLEAQGYEVQLRHNAGHQAEYTLLQPATLSAEQLAQLRTHWQAQYRLESHHNRLLLVCCQP